MNLQSLYLESFYLQSVYQQSANQQSLYHPIKWAYTVVQTSKFGVRTVTVQTSPLPGEG
jgi:hypothetical protein